MNVPIHQHLEQADKLVTARVLADDGRDGVIAINGDQYDFHRLGPADGIHSHVRLVVGDPFTDARVYDVAQTVDGYFECSCADFIYRGGPDGVVCKHIAACRNCGLLNLVPAFTEAEKDRMSDDHDDWTPDKDGNVWMNHITGEVEGF